MSRVRDTRFLLLAMAALLAAIGLADPTVERQRTRVDALFVIDITGSMNVRDYVTLARPQSRLDHVKQALARLFEDLPCGSRAGLAVFAERRPFLLVAPVETCANFAPLAGTLGQLDWRMAWEGDSYIASGLYQSIDLAASLATDLVFLSDGQEAPPMHWSGPAAFEGKPGDVRGLVVGVGDRVASPIPRFDRDGREDGFLSAADVTQENRSGAPPPDAEQREGWHPRNAPWGASAASGEEHLSALHEDHLRTLAGMTGLGYATLTPGFALEPAIMGSASRRESPARLPLSPWLAVAGLVAVLAAVLPDPLRRRRARRPPAASIPIVSLQRNTP